MLTSTSPFRTRLPVTATPAALARSFLRAIFRQVKGTETKILTGMSITSARMIGVTLPTSTKTQPHNRNRSQPPFKSERAMPPPGAIPERCLVDPKGISPYAGISSRSEPLAAEPLDHDVSDQVAPRVNVHCSGRGSPTHS